MDLDLTRRMVVREAMSSPVVTVDEDQDLVRVAEMMRDNNIGAVIVAQADGQPVGIVTERDIVVRVVSKGIGPRDVRVKEVMTSPLRTVGPEMSLADAMAMMSRHNIRRLGVTYKGRLVGIVSDKDILRIVPAIIEIAQERSRIKSGEELVGPSLVGYCDSCGMYSTNLKQRDGDFICEDCRAEI
ncbi:MAG: cyclic nucleotide-binding/CBS domain-containing protein [Candidatus Bathyarchaeia archaeon]